MMDLNDLSASELISQSLDRPLSDDEAQSLDEYLAKNPAGQKFARVVRLIQKIAGDMMHAAENGEHLVEGTLPDSVRVRIEQMLASSTRRESRQRSRKRDLVFASVLLDSKRMSANQLSNATRGWESSNSSLSDFLVDQCVISDDACDVLESRVDSELMDTITGLGDDTVHASTELGRWSIHRSGVQNQLSQLLGLTSDEPENLDVKCCFRLLRQIGEGGLGSVWLAQDQQLNRTVAIKRLHTDREQSSHVIARFRREAAITGRLEHPNIVPVYMAGTADGSGKEFYAMRFLGKRTLGDAIREYHDGLTEQKKDAPKLYHLLGLFLRVCDAVAYAHSRGVVHRDLKPDNIALDSFGQVIVLDWGLAKVIDEGELGLQMALGNSADDSAMLRTMAGSVMGTPLYMSPEQAAGDLDNINQRTDVYGLGAILFAILTGRAPHQNSCTAVDGNTDVDVLLTAIASKESQKPREINPDISVDLEAICYKAMAFNRHVRYESVTHLSEAIIAWVAGSHEKNDRYEALRVQGRELASVLQNCFLDLANNARFMGCLPPIQGVIQAKNSDDVVEYNIWRERQSTIFFGLLRANAALSGATYQQVLDEQASDLVRVERHSTDATKMRAVPQSRLSQASHAFSFAIQQQASEEAVSQISLRDVRGNRQSAILETGIPVFDEQSEHPFGNIILESPLERLLFNQLSTIANVAVEVIVCDGDWRTLFHYTEQSSVVVKSVGSPVSDISAEWADNISDICLDAVDPEWNDETGKNFYIRRVIEESFDKGTAFILLRV
jgi:serine/threonine protein kinase